MNGMVIDKPYKNSSSSEKTYIDHEQDVTIFNVKKDSYIPKSQKEHIDFSQQIIERKPPFTLELNGVVYKLAAELQHIGEQINEAKEILDYEEGWDDEYALPTNICTFENAALFVLNYAQVVFENYGKVLTTPYIDILKDGSITVHWEAEEAQFLIVFKKDNDELAYYYAEQENKIPLKSAIELKKPVEDILVMWMQKNLA